MAPFVLRQLFALAILCFPSLLVAHRVSVPDTLFNTSVTAETVSVAGNIDGPKLQPGANATSYDWWWFDAVSTTSNATATVVFFDTGPDGYTDGYFHGPLTVGFSGAFSNGTTYAISAQATEGAVFDVTDDHIVVDWKGSGFSFVGIGLDTETPLYIVVIDAPQIGIRGSIQLQGRGAPAHYSCGPAGKSGIGASVLPHVFWSNVLPDAVATVDITFSDTSDNQTTTHLAFRDGVGYHDKNWGDVTFVTTLQAWYWGHARLGPYAVVWSDGLDAAGTEHVSGYVYEYGEHGSGDLPGKRGRGELLQASCTAGAVQVRPWGANSTYPPVLATGTMQGLELRFALGDGSGNKTLVANVTTGIELLDVGFYVRTLGTVTGVVLEADGSACEVLEHDGRALFEEFKMIGYKSDQTQK